MDIGFLLDWYYKAQFPFLKRIDEEKGHLWMVAEFYDSLDWNCTLPKPTFSDLENISIAYEKYKKANEHIEKRNEKMPSAMKQLELQYLDLVNGTTLWRDTIKALYDEFPAPVDEGNN